MGYALLIDDNRALLESYAALAEGDGIQLETAETWDDGLAMFHVLDPELVIADYNLPGSRMGLRLLAEVRRLRPSVRLILLSGFVDEADIERIEDLGIADLALTKSSPDTRKIVQAEIAAAAGKDRSAPTDWLSAARAHVAAAAVTDQQLDELDAIIHRKVEGK